MHYRALVLIPADGEPEEHVTRLMAPHREQHIEDPSDPDGGELVGFWDFWQIGGRYTGFLDGYDPEKDEANWEWCQYCNRTGTRTDINPAGVRCNACTYHANEALPQGRRVKWPTDWAPHAGDVQPCPFDLGDKSVYTLVRADGSAEHREGYDPTAPDPFPANAGFPERVRVALLEHTGRVVVVDYHC